MKKEYKEGDVIEVPHTENCPDAPSGHEWVWRTNVGNVYAGLSSIFILVREEED